MSRAEPRSEEKIFTSRWINYSPHFHRRIHSVAIHIASNDMAKQNNQAKHIFTNENKRERARKKNGFMRFCLWCCFVFCIFSLLSCKLFEPYSFDLRRVYSMSCDVSHSQVICVPAHSPIMISGFQSFLPHFSQQLISASFVYAWLRLFQIVATAVFIFRCCCYRCCYCFCFCFCLACKPWHTCVCRDDRCLNSFSEKQCENVHTPEW